MMLNQNFVLERKKDAIAAAAARTLDTFSARRCQEDTRMKPFRRCEDKAEDALPPEHPSLPSKLEMDRKPAVVPKEAHYLW